MGLCSLFGGVGSYFLLEGILLWAYQERDGCANVCMVDGREAFELRRRVLQLRRALKLHQFDVRHLSELLVLYAIEESGGVQTSGNIADGLHMQRSNVASYTNRLERDGLLTCIFGEDRRRRNYSLTGAGRAVLEHDRKLRDDKLAQIANEYLDVAELKTLVEASGILSRLEQAIFAEDRRQRQTSEAEPEDVSS